MRKRELELIAALAEGNLEDESEARALIAASSEHRAEYEAQKTALEALRSVPSAAMTEQEKAVLRRDVWSSLRSGPTATPKRIPWYYRWSFAGAAVLVVGIGLVAVLNQSGAEDATELAAFEETSQGLAEAPTAGDDGTDDATTEPTIGADSGGAAALESDPLTLYFRDQAGVARNEGIPGLSGPDTDLETRAEEQATCLQELGLEDHQLIAELPVADAANDDLDFTTTYLMVIPAAETLGEATSVTFIDTTTCEVVHIEE